MSRQRILNFAYPVSMGILIGGCFSFLCGMLISMIAADDALASALRSVEAVATDRGGVVESLHRNEDYSYSVTALIRDDQLGRLEALLADQPPVVTYEYVYSPSKLHDDHLRVGVDLRMTREHYSSEWWRIFWSPYSVLMMFMVFMVFAPCAFALFNMS